MSKTLFLLSNIELVSSKSGEYSTNESKLMIEIHDTTSNMKIENYISQNIDTYQKNRRFTIK